MKVGSKIILLFRDSEGFGTAIFESLRPKPQKPSSVLSLEEPFELSLDRYGIRDVKASGTILHFLDHQGHYQVSFLLMQNYEPPVLACAIHEVLEHIAAEKPSTILAPFIVASSKLKRDGKTLAKSFSKVPIYGVHVGPDSDTTRALVARTENLTCVLQIHHEPFACLLHLARSLRLPTYILVGERGRLVSDSSTEVLEILHELGDILASTLNLSFSKDRVKWSPKGTSKNSEEPWRALYG